jgi:hypothetical protein
MHHVVRHGALSRLMLTHDDWQLFRLWKDKLAIVAAFDPQHARHKTSGLDHKILEVSPKLAELMAGNVLAVHTYHPVIFSGNYPLEAEAQHKKVFKTLMDDVSLPKEQQMLINAAPVFGVQQAEESIDSNIVVMGEISRSMVADLMIGKTIQPNASRGCVTTMNSSRSRNSPILSRSLSLATKFWCRPPMVTSDRIRVQVRSAVF